MQENDVLEVLLELAADAGFRVKVAGRDAGDLGPLASGVCRVRGELWIVLSSGDPVRAQIRTLGAALRTHAAALVEERHLPPAVRAVLDDLPPIA